MPKHRTPTKVLETRGSFVQNPQRRRKKEPKAKGKLNAAPAHLTDAQKRVWKYLVDLTPDGVLMCSDAPAFETLVFLFSAFRDDPVNFTSRNYGTLLSLFGRFGYTPADRAKLEVEQEEEKDPFAALDGLGTDELRRTRATVQ